MLSNVTIKPFQPEDQAMAKNLILAGLAEHWDELDLSKNLDLNDITSTYASGAFFVAWFRDEIVGTGALIPHSAGIAQIVRMSVAPAMRRKRVATQILHHLIQYAQDHGYQKIVLETTKDWHEAIEFYLHNNFRITHYSNGDVYFVLDFVRQEKT
ncbi:MAG: GNAT family N-acetyltransferase [Anaerolineales bacterium]